MQERRSGDFRVESVDAVEEKIDARRQYQPVVGELGAAREPDASPIDIDGDRRIADDIDAAPRKRLVGNRDVGHRLAAAEDQVGERTRHECLVALDEGDVHGVAAPQCRVACGSGTPIATADDDDFALARRAARRRPPTQCQQRERTRDAE